MELSMKYDTISVMIKKILPQTFSKKIITNDNVMAYYNVHLFIAFF